MAYHGHPSTGTEAALEETRVGDAARRDGLASDLAHLHAAPASTPSRSWIFVLLGILGIAGLIIVAYLLSRML